MFRFDKKFNILKMFESEDWDLDQDFLNDVDDKAVKFYSQIDNQEAEPKRRKVELCSDPIFPFSSDVDSYEKKAIDKVIIKCDENKESRKNLILSMFNKNLTNKNVSQTVACDSKKSSDNTSLNLYSDGVQNRENNQLPRKNLVLGILNKKNMQDTVVQDNVKNADTWQIESKIKSSSNRNITQKFNVLKNNETKCQTYTSNSDRKNNFNNDTHQSHSLQSSRKHLLHSLLKQQPVNNIESKNDISKNNLSVIKHPQVQVQPNKKMTLVRKFPGPAGLLPDNIDANIPPVSYLNSLEENEKMNEENSSNFPEYCSQNTKNLFTEGAWQLMLDDLPGSFLKGYEIATIKQIASTSGCNSTKVKFLAGIVDHIDHSHDNPPIVLKDFTDIIQGIVHRDIPLKYPGLLEPNVVILLHDVGLLRTSGTFISNKYQILISPSSLLAIYTNKGLIERTHHMDSVLENASNGKIKKQQKGKENCIFTKPLEAHSSKIDFQFKLEHNRNTKSENTKKNIEDIKKKSVGINADKTTEDMNESIDFDIDLSFSVSPTKITNLQNQKIFDSSSLKKHTNEESKQQNSKQVSTKEKEKTQSDDKERAKNILKTLKRFVPDANAKKRPCCNSSLQMDVEHPVLTNTYPKEVEHEILDTYSKKMDIDEYDVNTSQQKIELMVQESSCCDKIRSIQLNNNQKENRSSIRSKLLQFKNPEALTPSENSEHKNENYETFKEKTSHVASNSFNDMLCNTENDSDDEMLSQLDMDNIFSNYNNDS